MTAAAATTVIAKITTIKQQLALQNIFLCTSKSLLQTQLCTTEIRLNAYTYLPILETTGRVSCWRDHPYSVCMSMPLRNWI